MDGKGTFSIFMLGCDSVSKGAIQVPRLKPHEKRAVLMQKRADLDAQLRGIEAQEREAERKRDTRRKVVAGAIALEQIARDPTGEFALQLTALLNQFVEPRARDLFPFLPVPPSPPPPETRPQGGQTAA